MAPRRALVFSEKEFYLDEFRGRTLMFAVHHDGPPERLRELGEVARELVANDTRALLLLGGDVARRRGALRTLERTLTAASPAAPTTVASVESSATAPGDSSPLLALTTEDLEGPDVTDELLARLWSILRATPFFLGVCAPCSMERLAAFAQRLAARLRVHKLVIVDPAGGVLGTGSTRPLSFLDESMMAQLLAAGEAEWVGLGARRPVLDAIRQGLVAGITSVNLCSLDGLARELFTYEGSGTLFTREDYCRVEPLGLDDFHEVEKLLERGQAEGYLKLRSPAEIARVLFSGYGATIGRHHLAGICSLQTDQYARHRVGEIVGLYTMTRFKGEGVGAKLVQRMKVEARGRALAYLFACTTQERAGQFFERQGFRRVGQDDVPPEKWHDYDERRRREVLVYRFDTPPSDDPPTSAAAST